MNSGAGRVPETHTATARGLSHDVEILIDEWGIPHIYAESISDAHLAQGFNAARDRLFQIDLWRRRGLGLLSEVLGSAHVEQDRAARLLLYRGNIESEWSAYASQTKEAVENFVEGINSYVLWTREDPSRLAPEFLLHGYGPSLWRPEDVARVRTHGLYYNAEHEVARARTIHVGGMETELLRQAREPLDPLVIPEDLDLSLFDSDTLRTYRLAFAPVDFSGAARPETAREGMSGSNNWVVDGSRTATGRPILANDPHRAVTLPSLRYVVHLTAPGLDVIGAGEPSLPGISIGHNQRVAFGLTIWPADVEDLYVYRTHPEDPSLYWGADGWTNFVEEQELITTKEGTAETVILQFTSHGPVIHLDSTRHVAIALRAAWLQPGMAPYLGSIGYNDAETAEDFREALSTWGAPAVNQIFATTDGEWGWQASGRLPRRSGWDGSLPVPGGGNYEWNGLTTSHDLPSSGRRSEGWFVSANENNLPSDWDNQRQTTTYDWYSPARSERIRDWLAHETAVSVEGSNALQNDTLNVHAVTLIARFAGLDLDDPAKTELDQLLQWDGREEVDSRPALIFQVWARKHLRPALLDLRLASLGITGSEALAATQLALRDESFGGDLRGDHALVSWALSTLPPAQLSAVAERTIMSSIESLRSLLGPDSDGKAWTWGSLHHTELTNSALRAAAVPASWATLGPKPRAGSGDTVGMAGYDSDFTQTIGSSFRMVLDVGQWDNSVAQNGPGQSGDPRSPHYSDHFDRWVEGRSFPLLYSRDAVVRHCVQRIVLTPRDGARTEQGSPL